MGLLTFLKRTAASVATPASNRASLFVDSTSGIPAIKDDTGVVTNLGGAAASSSTPTTIDCDDVGAVGVGTPYARSDHQHGAQTDAPVAIGAALAEGSSNALPRADHVHTLALTATQHGAQTSGTLHAAASTTVAGFESAADKSLIENHRLGWVNILDYGGDKTNATSSRTALTNAIGALPNGGVVFFPAGQYNLGNTAFQIDTAHITIKGAARYGTSINTTSTTEDTLVVGQYYVTFEDLMIQGPSTGAGVTLTSAKTAGYGINGAGTGFPAYTAIRRCTFFYQWDCINVGNVLMSIDDVECRYFKHSGIAITHNSDHQINAATMDNATSALPTGSGIDVQLTASLLLSNCNVIHSNFALNLSPANGVTVPSVKAVNCFFDTSVVGLNMTSAGSVFRSEFTNCWFSTMSTAGIRLQPTGTGTVDGITFVNCDIYNNLGGTTTGIDTGSLVKKWKMTGCSVAGWTTGVNLVAGANHFPTLLCNTIGAVAAFGVNATGIVIGAGAFKGIVIASNDVVDNTAAITIGAATFTVPSQFRITDNAGINPRGAVTPPIATPITATTYTNATGFRCCVTVRGATMTATNLNGVAMGAIATANMPMTLVIEPGASVTLTGTTLSWAWSGM